jgi:hypothetical protein
MRKLTKILLTVFFLFLLTVGAFACEMSYTLTDAAGGSRSIVPGSPVNLQKGETYSLFVSFTEDHGNCTVAPEETVFLLDEEKWKASKNHLPMQLLSDIEWKDTSSNSHEAELKFKAVQTGRWDLEVLRECDRKGGYDEYLIFSVS